MSYYTILVTDGQLVEHNCDTVEEFTTHLIGALDVAVSVPKVGDDWWEVEFQGSRVSLELIQEAWDPQRAGDAVRDA